MEDKGKKLYEMWMLNLLKQNILADEWEDLTPEDQMAWRWTADQILSGEL